MQRGRYCGCLELCLGVKRALRLQALWRLARCEQASEGRGRNSRHTLHNLIQLGDFVACDANLNEHLRGHKRT